MLLFISGIVFATVGINILNCLSDLIINLTELIKSNVALYVAKKNAQITELVDQSDSTVRAIGFITNAEEDENEE